MGIESFGHEEDATARVRKSKGGFVPTEEIASGAPSVEDQVVQREINRRLGYNITDEELEREGEVKKKDKKRAEEISYNFAEEAEKLKKPILVNGTDISSAVSGTTSHSKRPRLEDYSGGLRTLYQLGKQKDSVQKKYRANQRRASHKASPKK